MIANVSTGKLCFVNVGLAAIGITASLTLKDWAQIFAALATGVWFTTQTILSLREAARKRQARRAG